MTSFPVPKDVRGVRTFELIMGQDELIRNSLPIADPTLSFAVGEWVKPVTSGGVTKAGKLETPGDVVATPALGAKVCWTIYVPGDPYAGQSDAMATKQLDLLSGTYQAKTKLYNTGGTFAPGYLLVAVYDAAEGGILDAPDPAAMTTRQLQAVVGRVVEVAAGVLWYESPGL